MNRKNAILATLAIILFATVSTGGEKVLSKTTRGAPPIKSIDVISFAPNGVLLIGDGRGSQIIAVRTLDGSKQGGLANQIVHIDTELAARLGTKADGIEIIDLAVNPASGTAYIAVRKQDDKSYVVLTVDAKGTIGELSLDDVTYARIKLAIDNATISKITDVAWADSQLIAAGRSSEQFSSKIFSVDTPLSHDAVGNVYSAETYHVAHGRWETKAPMSVLIPLIEDDETYVVGAFSCTPIVKYPLNSLQPGATVKGSSVIELGSGNRPLDMFTYEKDGKSYVLANTFRFHHKKRPFGPSPYWTVKFDQSILIEKENVNEKALRRLGRDNLPATPDVILVEAYHGVMQMDRLDESRALVLRQSEEGVDLVPLDLP